MRPALPAAALALALALAFPAAAAPDARDARGRLRALNAREAVLSARMDANRSALVHLLSALESLRRDPPPALLVRPERARDAARAAILLRAVTPELQARARRFAREADELKRVRRQAAEAGAELFAAESARAEAAPTARPSPPRPGDLAPPPSAAPAAVAIGPPPQRLLAPVAGPPARRFGEVRPGRARSEGWGWPATGGAPVLAPAAGEVEFAGPLRGQGLVAVVRLAAGWRVVLSGLGRVTAPAGSTVRAGERLGEAAPGVAEVGLQLRRGAEAVDPAPMLEGR